MIACASASRFVSARSRITFVCSRLNTVPERRSAVKPLHRVLQRLAQLQRGIARRLAYGRGEIEGGGDNAVEIRFVDLAEGEQERLELENRLIAGGRHLLQRGGVIL